MFWRGQHEVYAQFLYYRCKSMHLSKSNGSEVVDLRFKKPYWCFDIDVSTNWYSLSESQQSETNESFPGG